MTRRHVSRSKWCRRGMEPILRQRVPARVCFFKLPVVLGLLSSLRGSAAHSRSYSMIMREQALL